MSQAEQLHRERAHLARFIQHRPPLTGANLVRGPRPDFIATQGSRRIGIEHTEIVRGAQNEHGSRLRGQERNEDLTVQLALRAYEAGRNPVVDVSFMWHRHTPVASGRVNELAGDIARLVARNAPQVDSCRVLAYPDRSWRDLPAEVESVRIARLSILTRNSWHTTRGTSVSEISVDEVAAAVERKEPLVQGYRTSCDDLWLLLVLDGFSPSGYLTVGDAVRQHRFVTSADRLFLLEYFDSRVTPLQTRP